MGRLRSALGIPRTFGRRTTCHRNILQVQRYESASNPQLERSMKDLAKSQLLTTVDANKLATNNKPSSTEAKKLSNQSVDVIRFEHLANFMKSRLIGSLRWCVAGTPVTQSLVLPFIYEK